MSKYATCPWSAQADNKTIVSADGVVVALVQINRTRQNADLIASAPELLKALQMMLDRSSSEFWPIEQEIARSAIAKATGGAQ